MAWGCHLPAKERRLRWPNHGSAQYTSLDKNCICEAHLQCVIRFSGQYFSSENHFLKPIGGEMHDSFSFDRLDTSYAAQTSGLWLFQQTFLVLGAVVL